MARVRRVPRRTTGTPGTCVDENRHVRPSTPRASASAIVMPLRNIGPSTRADLRQPHEAVGRRPTCRCTRRFGNVSSSYMRRPGRAPSASLSALCRPPPTGQAGIPATVHRSGRRRPRRSRFVGGWELRSSSPALRCGARGPFRRSPGVRLGSRGPAVRIGRGPCGEGG